MTFDPKKVAEEARWLIAHPDFEEKPASIREFLCEEYLDIEKMVRPGLLNALVDIFGEKVNGKRISNYERALVTGGIGIGKGHTPDTPILTPAGWVALENIKEGDSVIGADGLQTFVTGVYPRGILDTYEVTFGDGASVIVDGDHLWNVKSPKQKARQGAWSTMTTLDIIESGVKNSRDQRKWHIPVVLPVEFDFQEDLPISPYLLGALLGDGSILDGSPKISSIDNEILARVENESGLELVHISRCDYRLVSKRGSGGLVSNWLTDELRILGIWGKRAHEKIIPRQYFTSSVKDRLDLLRGLMDTDGYILAHGSVQISSSSRQLAADIVELVRSLGGIARLTCKSTTHRDAHIVTINMRFNPFYLNRKAVRWAPFDKYEPARMIESIKPAGKSEIICISVKAENQLYVTKDFIVTHNTTFASIALPYMTHWVLCLRDPQKFFELLPGSRIAFMQMSTSEKQAGEVVFGDIFARIKHSEWFTQNYPYDPKFTKQIRFPKDIWILPGGSEETAFEGYNILAGILDEMDSHKVTDQKDYADTGYDCADSSTEILSKRGWLNQSELTINDEVLTLNHYTGFSEWNQVEEVKRYEVENESLMAMEGKNFSALTTKGHRWPVLNNKNERIWNTSETFACRDAIITCAENADLPLGKVFSDELVELVAWAYTEGNVKDGTLHIYQQTTSTRAERIVSKLEKIFGKASIYMRSGSVACIDPMWVKYDYWEKNLSSFRLNKAASGIILQHMVDKVPTHQFLMSLTQAQLHLFIEVSLLADNCGTDKLAQKNWAATEAFAFAVILSGKTVSIRPHSDKNVAYDMLLARILKRKFTRPRALSNAQNGNFFMGARNYTGIIWCPRTKNKSWFARRNGSVYFTGNTINSRIASRFTEFGKDGESAGNKGLLICIGQMKKGTGFAARKYKEFLADPKAYVVRMTIWESLGWHRYTKNGTRDSFWYDIKRKTIVPSLIVGLVKNKNLIEIPTAYKVQFANAPEKALRDLAGIPPAVSDPFISLVDRIEECRERWIEKHGDESPCKDSPTRIQFEPWFKGNGDPRKRHVHIDIATSGDGDALGMAMGYVDSIIEIDGEKKPHIVIDCLIRIKARPGTEILLSDVRRILYELKEDRGFRIYSVSMDGFQCLTGDTKVPLLDGRTLTMKELSEQYPEGGVHTYSFDKNTGRIAPGKVTKAWSTAIKEILEVDLDNGEIVRCTPDHRFMLRDGTYQQAQYLTKGQSLMPLYRRITDWAPGHMDNYEQVSQPGPRNTNSRSVPYAPARWEYTHRMVTGEITEDQVRHHVDHDHFNNSPENLEIITRSEHQAYHNQKEFWTEERTEAVSSAISKSNSERTGLDARRRRLDVTLDDLLKYTHLSRREVTELTGWSQDMIYARIREAGFSGWAEFRKNAPVNHKVVSVIHTGEFEEVYDLQIEDHHNFALESGIFVHNSTDTMQQLRKKKYRVDYLSVDKSTLPYEDLREAIYERRLDFPPYKTYVKSGDDRLVEVALQELMELTDTGRKIDHPPGGSKDLADAMAGVTNVLMGDRTYRKGITSIRASSVSEDFDMNLQATGTTGKVIPFPGTGFGLQAPLPPSIGGTMGLMIPDRLRPNSKES